MTEPTDRLIVTLDESWNALHRFDGSSSSLRHIVDEHTSGTRTYLHCCLGIAMKKQFGAHGSELLNCITDIGLPDDVVDFTEAWYTHRQVPDFMREVPMEHGDGATQTRPSEEIAQAIESEIATLNDVPYHKASDPHAVFDQLIYLFDLLGIDLVIPSKIRSMYFARWRPEFAAYGRGFVDGKRQGETNAAAREDQ